MLAKLIKLRCSLFNFTFVNKISCQQNNQIKNAICHKVDIMSKTRQYIYPGTVQRMKDAAGWLSRFTSTETVGLLGTGAQDLHLDFHTAPGL